MELTGVQKLARVLRVMVTVVFVCNIVMLLAVPGAVFAWSAYDGPGFFQAITELCRFQGVGTAAWNGPVYFAVAWVVNWYQADTAVLTLFLWVCGICTAIILWQARRVLAGVLKGETFTFGNAANMKRAAVCCFVISGAALGRTVWGLFYYQSITPLLTYNFLFFPLFLLAGLVCMVMSALFRQAAELKAENDLTI